jgi:hypothetical protein
MISLSELIFLVPNAELPTIKTGPPFKCILVLDASVSEEWQRKVSLWLVKSGCLYMMAWGKNCSSWDDSIDLANLESFNFDEIPDADFVMTTWHHEESLDDVLFFAINCANHPVVELERTIVIEIGFDKKFVN